MSESGDYTPKYYKAIEIIEKYEYPKLARPLLPTQSAKKSYPALKPTQYLPYESIIQQVPPEARFILENPSSMEDLPMNGNSGQSYGYLIHRKKTPAKNGTVLTVRVFLNAKVNQLKEPYDYLVWLLLGWSC